MRGDVTETSRQVYHDEILGKRDDSQYKLILNVISQEDNWTRSELTAAMRNVKNHHYAIGNHLIAAQYHALTEKSTMAARCNGLIKMGILRKCGKSYYHVIIVFFL